uniref:Secreted protein n=1 Tax=Strongyloides venezuelensis TaxID=75913 RepID=A0A0K0G401_STRVS
MKVLTITVLLTIIVVSYTQISKRITINQKTGRASYSPTQGDFRSFDGPRASWSDAFITPSTWGCRKTEHGEIKRLYGIGQDSKTQTNGGRALMTILVLILPQYLYQTICIVNEL